MASEDYKRTVRLADASRDDLLNKLDSTSQDDGGMLDQQVDNRREDRRLQFRGIDIAVVVEHPGGGVSRILVCPRNLSSGGLGFLHGGFLYTSSRCRIVMPKLDGKEFTINGTIMSCRHVQGHVHEIGVKFDSRIEPQMFLQSAVGRSSASNEACELSDLRGKVLYMEDSAMDARLFEHHIQESGIDLKVVSTPGAALDEIKKNQYDIALLDLNLQGEDGAKIISEFRALGFEGPVAAVTAETEASHLQKAREAGASDILQKPYQPEQLINTLVNLHHQSGAVLGGDRVYSSLDDQAGMHELIEQYIEEAQRIAAQLQRAISEDKIDQVRELTQTIRGSAEGYGFPSLGEAAEVAVRAIDSSGSLSESIPQLRRVTLITQNLAMRESQRKEAS